MVCLLLRFMNLPIKFILPLSIILVACQTPEVRNDEDTFVIAYLQEALPGIEFNNQNQLSNIMDNLNTNEKLNIKLIEKVYSTLEELEEAVLNDSSIDMALLPDFLIERHRQNWITPPLEGNIFSYMPEFEEHQASYFMNVLDRNYRTEEFKPKDLPQYLDTFIPYSFGHYGVAYHQEDYPLRLRRIEDIFSFVPLDQIMFDADIRSMNYVASLITYREELNQAFELFNTEKINLFQYQSLLSSYLNTSDAQTANTLSDFSTNQWPSSLTSLPNRRVYIGPSHQVAQQLIRIDNSYRFEYLRDASMMYFNGFVFLNELDLEFYSLFIDGLYNPVIVNNTLNLIKQSVVTNHASLLNQFSAYADSEGLLETNFTFWFDSAVTQSQNVIFNYDRASLLSTTYPNQTILDTSVIKYDSIQSPIVDAYREGFNPNYGLTHDQSLNPLFLLLIPTPFLFILATLYVRKKRILKNVKQESHVKPYKIKKILEKAQKQSGKVGIDAQSK